MDKSGDKRSIDRIRDSAFSMQVGGTDDGAICRMISVGDKLHLVLEHAIFTVQLADQVDPERTNAAVPNTKQRVLSRGSKDPAVGKILLTAHAMFKSTHLGSDFPEQRGLSLAFDFLRDIAAMMDMHAALVAVIQKITAEVNDRAGTDRSIELPAVGDAKERCDAFAQRVGHAIDRMKDIAELFYPGELSKKWIDSLAGVAAQKHGDDEPLTRFVNEVRGSLLFMIEIRNMIEHPREDAYVRVQDFRLTADMHLVPPNVAIMKPGGSPRSCQLSAFMADITEELLSIGELFIALLCGAKIESFAGFPLVVVEVPEGRRSEQNPHQRISYGIVMDGEVQPLG